MLADTITIPRKQARVTALTLLIQNLRHLVSCDLPRDGGKMAELFLLDTTRIVVCGCLRITQPKAPLYR